MKTLTYFWINVFTTEQDKGNPLPVFVLDDPLSKTAMQKIAAMLNQSETVFIEHVDSTDPKLSIFTPMQALPFAGHPIIGALKILEKLQPNPTFTQVKTESGNVPVEIDRHKHIYWIKAPLAPTMQASTLTIASTAQMLGLMEANILSCPTWVNTGSEQLLVELDSAEAVDAIAINPVFFKEHATLYEGRTMIYVWSRTNNDVYARYFYLKNGAIGEDSGTGSAAANLGGLHCLNGTTSLEYRIRQGCKMGRENVLYLKVVEGEIWIGGQNTFMGQGELLWAE